MAESSLLSKVFGIISTPKISRPSAKSARNAELKSNDIPADVQSLSGRKSELKDDHDRRDGHLSSAGNLELKGDHGHQDDQPLSTSNPDPRGDHNHGDEQWLAIEGPSPETPPQTINVVLFGETGVGKSSVINLIARKKIAKVSTEANGCTMQSHRYDIPFDNMDFAIFDTIGLEEPQMGVNGYLKAIEKAYELISKLSTAGGIHLLLFCMRGGRITATTQSNYRMFCECLCNKEVPIALVFTGLEREDRMENWWDRNRTHIEKYGIESQGHACITAVQDDAPGDEDKYKQSQETIRELLKTCARNDGAYSPESQRWFARLGLQLRSFLPAKKNPKKKDIMKLLTNRCKLDVDTAKRIAEMMDKSDTEGKGAQPEEGSGGKDGPTIYATNDYSPGEVMSDIVADGGRGVAQDGGPPRGPNSVEVATIAVANRAKDALKNVVEDAPLQKPSDVKPPLGVAPGEEIPKNVADAGTLLQEPSDVKPPLEVAPGKEVAKNVADANALPLQERIHVGVVSGKEVTKNMADARALFRDVDPLLGVVPGEEVAKNVTEASTLLQESNDAKWPSDGVSGKEVSTRNVADASAPLHEPSSVNLKSTPVVLYGGKDIMKNATKNVLVQESSNVKGAFGAASGKEATRKGGIPPQKPSNVKAAPGHVVRNGGKAAATKSVALGNFTLPSSNFKAVPPIGKEGNNSGKSREKGNVGYSVTERMKSGHHNAG